MPLNFGRHLQADTLPQKTSTAMFCLRSTYLRAELNHTIATILFMLVVQTTYQKPAGRQHPTYIKVQKQVVF